MTGGRGGKAVQQTKLNKYAIQKGSIDAEGPPDWRIPAQTQIAMEEGFPTLYDVMEAIKGVCTSLKSRIDLVTREMGLLRADLRNMASRVKEVKDFTSTLREDIASLKTQVNELQFLTTTMQARLEDCEGRSR
ncbi:hypothetical protein NDU88_002821 [Pleurodeles waltl]|uniref:Uncharacterized protein n=1 Tax=Pleurodeles waltl TaxID=8319 RepID=A0AAV7RD65_PLEWA|nr:hypothetical protein NDU88_002821 [Pleurodeles waltl]